MLLRGQTALITRTPVPLIPIAPIRKSPSPTFPEPKMRALATHGTIPFKSNITFANVIFPRVFFLTTIGKFISFYDIFQIDVKQ